MVHRNRMLCGPAWGEISVQLLNTIDEGNFHFCFPGRLQNLTCWKCQRDKRWKRVPHQFVTPDALLVIDFFCVYIMGYHSSLLLNDIPVVSQTCSQLVWKWNTRDKSSLLYRLCARHTSAQNSLDDGWLVYIPKVRKKAPALQMAELLSSAALNQRQHKLT